MVDELNSSSDDSRVNRQSRSIIARVSLKNFIITILVAFNIHVNLYAQNDDIKFERISLEHDLSQSMISCITQDMRGFIWLGTNDGLYRYDGCNFVRYSAQAKNPNSLSHNIIYSIFEDHSGDLWVGTWGGGLNRYNRENERFIRYQNDPNDSTSLSHNRIWSIFEDRSRVLWIGTDGGGLEQFNRHEEKFIHHVLVVDDSTDNRKLIKNYLNKSSTYKLVFANNGQQAVDAFEERTISLILMDMEMPVMDGYTATETIRQLENGPELPIIALSAHQGSKEIKKCLDSGCTAFVSKPVRKAEIHKIMLQYLNEVIQIN